MLRIKEFFSSLRKKIRRNRNSQFPIFLLTVSLGYVFFFSSKFWIPDGNTSDVYTNMETTISLDNRDFTLKNWMYAPEQKLMEIEIDVTNNNFDNLNQYLFSCRDQDYELVRVTPVIEENNLLVVHISDIPEDFKELSFRIKVDYGEETSEAGDMVRFYTNRDMIRKVERIEVKSISEYYAARLKRNIETYEQTLTLLEQEIDDISAKIALANNEITTLKERIPLQSPDDAMKSNKRIAELNETITDFELQITSKQDSILETREKITEANTRLQEWDNSQD